MPTERQFTGQIKDTADLLARYYDPVLARFVSADSIVPGTAAGSGGAAMTLGYDDGVELRPLTVDFHEVGFASTVGEENRFTQQKGFQFQLNDEARKEAKHQWGPLNPQALNRYSYTLNNPLRYTDPTGHWIESALDIAAIAYDIYMLRKEGLTWENALALAADIVSLGLPFVAGLGILVRVSSKGARIYQVALKVDNARLQRSIDQLFKATDTLPGGTAGAIREELRTGKPVGGRFHSLKGKERVNQLRNILKEESLSSTDRSMAEAILKDLQDALAGR